MSTAEQIQPAELWGVHRDDVDETWPLVRHFIDEALERGGRHTPDEVYEDLMDGKAQLWVAWGSDPVEFLGVMVTYIQRHPLSTILRIWLCVGKDRKRWVHHLPVVEAWAKEQGCDAVVAVVRPGWEKVLTEYQKTHVTLEKTI